MGFKIKISRGSPVTSDDKGESYLWFLSLQAHSLSGRTIVVICLVTICVSSTYIVYSLYTTILRFRKNINDHLLDEELEAQICIGQSHTVQTEL